MQIKKGLQDWWSGLKIIAQQTSGMERVVGITLYFLTLVSLTQWVHIGFGTKERPLHWMIDAYVVGVLLLSFWIFSAPSVGLAWWSTYFSASTVIVLLNVVLLQRVFGEIPKPERSLLLFICNVAQIVLMFATWYHLKGGYSRTDALLKSIVTFATIGYAENAPRVAMLQIATDFILLAIFLSHLVAQFGRAAAEKAKKSAAS